jgi:hypothetical protein
VFKTMRLALGAAALALCVGTGTGAYAQDQQGGMTSGADRQSGMMGTTSMSDQTGRTDWSRRFRLTPLEHKRLRAMGLTNSEVFGVANAAEQSGLYVDDIAQMVLRGREFFQIARDLNIPFDRLNDRRPEWETAEWDQAVREGWYTHRQGQSSMTMERQRTMERRESTTERQGGASSGGSSNQR